jgi:hypothetical protein
MMSLPSPGPGFSESRRSKWGEVIIPRPLIILHEETVSEPTHIDDEPTSPSWPLLAALRNYESGVTVISHSQLRQKCVIEDESVCDILRRDHSVSRSDLEKLTLAPALAVNEGLDIAYVLDILRSLTFLRRELRDVYRKVQTGILFLSEHLESSAPNSN